MDVARITDFSCLTTARTVFYCVGDSASLLQFSVWAKQASFTSLETSIQMEIQEAFTKHELSFRKLSPHQSSNTHTLF